MLGEVQYGGRVTDDYDKRLLNTFTKVWFTEVLFDQAFNFYEDYRIMRHKSIQKYLDEIEFLPGIDPPQAYGLHPNADIRYSYLKKTLSKYKIFLVSVTRAILQQIC